MKMSFAGLKPGCLSNQASRALFTSGRCCSEACVIFFSFQRDAVTLEEAPERCDPDAYASLAQLSLEFGKCRVGLLYTHAENEGRLGLDAPRPAVATLVLGHEGQARAHLRNPADRARRTHPKPRRCLAARHPLGTRINTPLSKIQGQRWSHACWPPSPACSLNHSQANSGIPLDSIRSEFALDREKWI